MVIEGDPVTTNIYLHGDTGAGGPEMTANVPPLLSFFYHVSFSKVKIKIKHND
ncbi:MAG: hypothetical protein L3K25_06100 [Gammaproteobacteria bacterium]|nr:hypothetical protein [Gammaproteobacteria bacterium]MCF6337208.1 hypothetical protein [Gammaproteobacteria bacterium]